MDNLFEKYKLKQDRVSDKIITILEQAILDGTLKTGDKLPTEEKTAEQFKVSKVVVREALREMESRGLIRKERGMYGGNFVSAPDVNRVGKSLVQCFQFGTLTEDEIIDFRLMLEPVLIKQAAFLRTEEDLAAMKANLDACEKEPVLIRKNLHMQIRFHILITKACHNSLFTTVMEAFVEIFENITENWEVNEKTLRQDLDYNHKFYDCIFHRRGDEAEKLMKEHFELTKAFRDEDLEKINQTKKWNTKKIVEIA